MTNEVILEARELSRIIDDHAIVDRFSFSFHRNSIYSVIGPSGAGKSSLLRLLNRLDEPTSGDVLFEGKNSTKYSPCDMRRRIGYLFQTPHLFPKTVRDNLNYAEHSLTEQDLIGLLQQVHIDQALLDVEVETLSVGQKQRVALGRLLATGPQVLLLDEPTSALDPGYTEAIETTINEVISQTSITVIMVTHHPEQAVRMGGQVLLIVDGQLVESGPCEQVVNDPRTDIGRIFRARQLR